MSGAPERFDIIVVDFPFIERDGGRRRPVLILTDTKRNEKSGTAIIAMITRHSASPWPGDVPVSRFEESGLNKPCKIRMKLHTMQLDEARIVGSLHDDDRLPVLNSLRETLSL